MRPIKEKHGTDIPKLPGAELLQHILSLKVNPCITLYQPLQNNGSEDRLNFRNLVSQLKASLVKTYSIEDVRILLKPLFSIYTDNDFWKYSFKGFAFLRTFGFFRVIGLPFPVSEFTYISDHFFTKPLRQYLQSTDRYQILGLNSNEIQLFEGNRFSVNEIELSAEIQYELIKNYYSHRSYAKTKYRAELQYTGIPARDVEESGDFTHFFFRVGRVIEEKVSRISGLPLILAALPSYQKSFQNVCRNIHLLPYSIPVDTRAVSNTELSDLAWKIIKPDYLRKIEALCNEYEDAVSEGKGSSNVKEIVKATISGRVKKLLIEEGRIMPGKLVNKYIGTIENGFSQRPGIDDLFDDIGEIVKKLSGAVMIIPREMMPVESGIAAVLRY